MLGSVGIAEIRTFLVLVWVTAAAVVATFVLYRFRLRVAFGIVASFSLICFALALWAFISIWAAFERRYGYSRAEVLGQAVHELHMWCDPADRMFLTEQSRQGVAVRNNITWLRTESGEIKLTAYSADRIHFDGQPCVLAVSEDLPEFDQRRSELTIASQACNPTPEEFPIVRSMGGEQIMTRLANDLGTVTKAATEDPHHNPSPQCRLATANTGPFDQNLRSE